LMLKLIVSGACLSVAMTMAMTMAWAQSPGLLGQQTTETSPSLMAPAPVAAVRPSPQAEAKPAPQPMFMVTNVRHDDVLNVRSGPSADYGIVGELPPGSRGIAITSECRARWCPVTYQATAGWVNRSYLAPEEQPSAAALSAALNSDAAHPSAGPTLRDSPEAPRSCLKPAARALLDRIEQKFGPVRVVSTCRAGAMIAGTNRVSRHASGNAIDFDAGGRKPAILEWLIANHRAGGVMTYAGLDHIHVDIGPHFVSLARGRHWSARRSARRDPSPPAAAPQ
jgi:SH3-like domain-containing protein